MVRPLKAPHILTFSLVWLLMISSFAVSQILVGFAATFDVLSFQFRDRGQILACLAVSSALVACHFFILGNQTAGLCTLLSATRFVVAYFSKRRGWIWVFSLAATLVLIFTYESPLNFLPFLGAILGAVGSFHGTDKVLRVCAMVGTVGWVIHNAVIGSPAAFGLEALFLASNLLGFWRFYLRGTNSALDARKGEQ
jgi:hypothetical protein